MRSNMRAGAFFFLVAMATSTPAFASLDLTVAGNSGFINGAFYTTDALQPTGSGNINSFVRLDDNVGTTQGYNTTNEVLDTGASDIFNHELFLTQIPVKILNGIAYREFVLDINESNGTIEAALSLDEVQIFVGSNPNSSVTSFTGDVLNHPDTLVYRMDAAPDGPTFVALNYELNPGSGGGDMFLYVPSALFDGYGANPSVTLYSTFGELGTVVNPPPPPGNYDESAGYEEWAVREGGGPPGRDPLDPLPEPATAVIWGLGLAGFGIVSRRRLQKSAN